MQKMNHYLTEKQIEILRKYAEKTGLSIAEVIRRAVDCYFHDVNIKNL